MKFKFFKFMVAECDESSEQINEFFIRHKIVHVDKSFVADGGNSFWAFCITFLEKEFANQPGKKEKIDYKEILNQRDFAIFAQLRNLRKRIAVSESIPAYAIFTNEQLADMVRREVTNLTEMEKSKVLEKLELINMERISCLFSGIKFHPPIKKTNPMKRISIDIRERATYENLCLSAYLAAKAKRCRQDVVLFFSNFDQNIVMLSRDILRRVAPYGRYRRIIIHDPKKRTIHAACFEDRIMHHAIMNLFGPILENAMIASTFACRKGKGTLAAVHAVQQNLGKHPFFVKIDIRKYFDSIDHCILSKLLFSKFKGDGVPELIEKIIGSYCTTPGKGIPIGTLTSQYFANYFLDGFDRFILENQKARAYVRYMDDMIWWVEDRKKARETLQAGRYYLQHDRALEVKESVQIGNSFKGVKFCGFRILPSILKLTKRKKKRFLERKRYWEREFLANRISADELQLNFSSVSSIITHADSLAWRKSIQKKEFQLEA